MTSAALTPGHVTFLVGTSYNGEDPAHWCIWHEPYDQIIEALSKRQKQVAPGRGRFVVMEVQVRDTTVVASEVTVV